MKLIYIFLIYFSLLTLGHASEIRINPADGLFEIHNGQSVFISAKYVAWAKKWKWDNPSVKRISTDAVSSKYTLNLNQQRVRSHILISKVGNNLNYTYDNVFSQDISQTIGAGIEFNLDLQSQTQIFNAKAPKLLPNKLGWTWEFKPGEIIEVKFTRPILSVYFERGKKSKIRTMFFGRSLTKGRSQISMQVILPEGSKFTFIKKDNDGRKWLNTALNPTAAFINLSWLNDKPAGNKGFITSVNDRFEFPDGSTVQFFGTNVQANSLFIKDKKLIKQHAKRLAQLGFNLVRLHHLDSFWVKNNLIKAGSTTQKINNESLDSYFWWVKCLRDEGIYVWVDLQVQRPWREGDDIPGWASDLAPKAKKGMNVAKGFVYLNKRMQALTKEFNKQLLTRKNPYTQLALKDDPAVMGVMITNENDLTHHFGNSFLKDKKHPYHQRLFDKEVSAFAEKFDLPEWKVRETWKPGYSKFLLNDLEARFNQDMIHDLRELGVKVPITTTSLWGRNAALFSLPALTTGDMVDAHSYAGGGIFKKSPLQKNPQYSANFMHALGQGQVAGKPFTVTEYNVGQRDDLESAYIPAVSVATMAAFQGWDATMLYGYSQDGLKGGRASPWSSYTHPAIMGVIPAMALLYRQGHVAPAKQTVVLAPANDDIFTKNISPKTSVAIRTTLEQHRMVVAMPETTMLPWLKPSRIEKDSIVIRDMNKNMLPANQDFIEADTGEFKRNWKTGIMTVNTPLSQLAMGKIGEQNIVLGDVVIQAKTPSAAIIFTSLDKKPLKQSDKILISAVARVAKVKKKWRTSYISEPVIAELALTSMHDKLNLIPLNADGSEATARVLSKNAEGQYSFSISEKDKTHWYLIKKVDE